MILRLLRSSGDYSPLSVLRDSNLDNISIATSKLFMKDANAMRPNYYKKTVKNENGSLEVQPVDIIEAYELNYNCGTAVAYILRAKYKEDYEKDLKKAITHLQIELDKAKVRDGDNMNKQSPSFFNCHWEGIEVCYWALTQEDAEAAFLETYKCKPLTNKLTVAPEFFIDLTGDKK